MTPKLDVSMSSDEVQRFLAPPRSAVLATNGPDGYPHSVAMWFIPGDRALLMWTYAKSQKAKNVARDPRCAFLVEDGVGYHELRGVLIRGSLVTVTDPDSVLDIGRALYERYTLPATRVPVDEGPHVEIARQARKRIGLVLPIANVASWDHSKLK